MISMSPLQRLLVALKIIKVPIYQGIIEVDAQELTQILNRAENADLRKILINWKGHPHTLDIPPDEIEIESGETNPFSEEQRKRWWCSTVELSNSHSGNTWGYVVLLAVRTLRQQHPHEITATEE